MCTARSAVSISRRPKQYPKKGNAPFLETSICASPPPKSSLGYSSLRRKGDFAANNAAFDDLNQMGSSQKLGFHLGNPKYSVEPQYNVEPKGAHNFEESPDTNLVMWL